MIGAAVGLAGCLLNTGLSLALGGKQRRMGRRAAAQADDLNRQSLGYANDVLSQARQGQAEARNLYNARMANAGAIEKDIYQNQANTLGSLSKNATDSSQLLALAGGVQGNTNQALNQLQQVENEDKQRRYYNVQSADQNVQGALGGLSGVYGNQAAMAQQSANQLMAAGMQNQQNGLDTLTNTAMMAGMGQFGDLSSMFGGKGMYSHPYTSSVNAPNRIGGVMPMGGTGLNLPNLSLPNPFK